MLAAGLLAQAAFYTVDLYAAYPNRAAPYFDTGEIAAITTARDVAGSHRIYLSDNLDPPYIEAFFAFLPPPPPHPVTDDATPGLDGAGDGGRPRGDRVGEPSRAGDMLVLSAYDSRPATAERLDARRPGARAGECARRIGAATGAREPCTALAADAAPAAKVGAPTKHSGENHD